MTIDRDQAATMEDVGADKLVQADTDGDGNANFEILLQNDAGTTLSAADFFL